MPKDKLCHNTLGGVLRVQLLVMIRHNRTAHFMQYSISQMISLFGVYSPIYTRDGRNIAGLSSHAPVFPPRNFYLATKLKKKARWKKNESRVFLISAVNRYLNRRSTS